MGSIHESLQLADERVHAVESINNSMRLFRLKTGETSLAQDDAVALRIANKSQTGN